MKQGMKRLWVTIDTEMDADIHWHKSWPPQYTSVLEGIPRILRPLWNRCGVHPVYFVSPEVLYSEACCRVLKSELAKGAVIGAHLHPEYIEPQKIWGKEIENVSPQFPNTAYDFAVEKEKIQNLTHLIQEKLGVTPVWYRGARFGADMDTIRALRDLGYQYDSSVTPHIDWSDKGGPDYSRAPLESYFISAQNLSCKDRDCGCGVREYPVTIMGKRWGVLGKLLPDNWLFYRWLRPTHMTYLEMKHLIKQLQGQDTLVMMFHSMEVMVKKTPFVRNRWMQSYYLWRLEKILRYAREKGYVL